MVQTELFNLALSISPLRHRDTVCALSHARLLQSGASRQHVSQSGSGGGFRRGPPRLAGSRVSENTVPERPANSFVPAGKRITRKTVMTPDILFCAERESEREREKPALGKWCIMALLPICKAKSKPRWVGMSELYSNTFSLKLLVRSRW